MIERQAEMASIQTSVLDALAAHIALVDESGVILVVNEAWRRFARRTALLSPQFAVGENYLHICDTATGADCAEARPTAAGIREVLAGKTPSFVLEYPCHSTAESAWFRMMVTPLTGPGSGSGGAVIMHVDVTDRRGAQQRYEQSEAQYLLLLNSTAEGIYRLDVNGVCTFCNPTAARLLGYHDPRMILGTSAHEHHHHSHADGSFFAQRDCKVHPLQHTGQGIHSEDEVFFRADGSQFPVEYWSYPILAGPDISGTVVTFLDITQRRSLEAQFLQSQKMEVVGRLAGGVAHDFNNALQVILTYGELLEGRLTNDSIGMDHTRQILLAARRAASLTHQLLTLSRKQLLRPVLFDLSTATIDIEEILRMTIGEDIRLTINRFAHVGTIEADRGQIQQILMNLTINARDAMPAGGELMISTSNVDVAAGDIPLGTHLEPGLYAMLSVRDTGLGMDPATQARIFEPFFTTKAPGKGTGLGLSIVYGIVKQSKGFIVVDGTPGQGTEFKLFFPVVSGTPDNLPPQSVIGRPPRGSETIFLLEDENPLRAVIRDTLRANGYHVLEAADGSAAIKLAGEYAAPIDLLLTDVILPGFSGRIVAARLQQSRPRLKVLYMSGYTGDFNADGVAIDPRILLLEKPFSMGFLLLTIRQTLDGSEEERTDPFMRPL
jgi:PAS domain S-box-containing protein